MEGPDVVLSVVPPGVADEVARRIAAPDLSPAEIVARLAW
jgi:hypothetical protein